ncbi:MAG: efflux RND transporter permease subunit, partial [Armatimonadetes bacterium]|nr:efflux RND transporter permease subunit [Armatimonadota bacterium]
NYYISRDGAGAWRRNRAVTIAVEMRAGEKIGDFGDAVDQVLDDLKERLPADLIMARTSDQPRQVEESIHLFMNSLYEAIILVVIVSLIGFWEWRSALLMALAIPITLAMTFGMMHVLGLDLQQVSIATLIIALGLLVDDPVVAGDAIKRDLAAGHPPGDCRLAGANQARHGHSLRHHHQYRGVPPIPDAHWRHRQLPVLAAHRDGLFARCLPHRVDDFHSAAGLLHLAARPRDAHRGAPQDRLWRPLLCCRHVVHRAPLEGAGGIARRAGARRRHFHPVGPAVLPGGRILSLLRRCVAA